MLGPLPGPIQLHSNATPAAPDPVRVFYTAITRYRPLGIPHRKKIFWPLLSKRLARELDSLESCETDYDRRYGDFLRATQYKTGDPVVGGWTSCPTTRGRIENKWETAG